MPAHRHTPIALRLTGIAGLTAAMLMAVPGLAAGSTAGSPATSTPAILLTRQSPGGSHGGGGGGGGGNGGGGHVTDIGYDVSYPQCGQSLPTNVLFGIVGVNDGIVYGPNPCLGANGGDPSELAWAEANAPTGEHAQLYANTGNPGPAVSSYWPTGQTTPQVCDPAVPDSQACNYDYGWNAAENSYNTAVAAYASIGLTGNDATATPFPNVWWLDVETGNSWRDDPALNVATLQGAVDYLASRDVAAIGFYSSPSQWATIVGAATNFAAYPSWVAGARTLRGAQRNCTAIGFTGGPVALAQYFASGYDADLEC